MRLMRLLVLVGLVLKVALAGALWWESTALAEGDAKKAEAKATEGDKGAPSDLPVAAELLAKARGFRQLLEAVMARQAELDAREKTLAAREETLKSLEKTVGEQVARLEGMTKTLAKGPGGGATGAGVAATGPAGLTKIYETMKAEEAAPILDKMDEATVRDILGRMKEKQIGAILAAMERDRAVAITKALAAPRRDAAVH
ncbi:MAG: hypothetical protein U0807_00655 [Candidatus Binatia bacterium]